MTKISHREITIMLKKAMDDGKYRDIADPIKRVAQKTLKNRLNNVMPKISKYSKIPFHKVGIELLNRVSSDTGSTIPKQVQKRWNFPLRHFCYVIYKTVRCISKKYILTKARDQSSLKMR